MTYSSNFIDVKGTRLHYLHWQSGGPPVLFIHGNTHCGGVYAPLAEKLAPEFSVVALDLRGHGQSDKPGPYSWAALRDDAAGLIDALGLDDLLIVCHSRGGGVGLLAAAARADSVRGVVAYEPNVPLQHWHVESAEERTAQLMERAKRRRDSFPSREEMYKHFKGRGAFKDWQDEYLRAYVEHGSLDAADGTVTFASPTSVEALFYGETFNLEEWNKIHDCAVPVLAIFGEDGGRVISGQDPVAALRTIFKTVDLKVLPHSTHSGPMEHPGEFEQMIRDFAATLPLD